MKFTGIQDNEFEASVRAAHNEALEKIKEINLAWVQNNDYVEIVDRLEIEISNRLATTAGKAISYRKFRKATIKLNYRLLKANPKEIRETYLHEFAHIVASFAHDNNCGHDRRWQRIAQTLGTSSERCHTLDVSNFARKVKRFIYGCQVCNKEYKLTAHKHKKHIKCVELGSWGYRCRCNGNLTFKKEQ